MSEEKKNIPVFVGTAPVDDEPVAYLDIGEGGYMDLGTDLTDDQLELLPKGRHMLAVIGTHGVHGYTTAPVAAQAQPDQDSIALDRLADYIADTWPMDKKYSIEEICKRLHGMWPGEFMPAEQVDKQTETQGKPVDESPNLQSQKQPVSGADEAGITQAAHELKINPEPFQALKSGVKTAEIRDCTDRVFIAGQVVRLREYEDGGYNGAELYRTITHIQRGYGLPDNLCVLSYGPCPVAALTQQDADKVGAERYIFLRDYAGQSWAGWVDEPNEKRSDAEIDESIAGLKDRGEWLGSKRNAGDKV